MKILIVDDEEGIRKVIKEYCSNENYETDEASNGKEALDKLKTNTYDILVLDIMMPEMDGFSMLKELPKEKKIPTIVLSARGEEYDKLTGFDLGIDDYVTKPFSPKELMARIKAHTKRSIGGDTISAGNIVVDNKSHTVKIDGKEEEFTSTQYDLLLLFLNNQNIALSREKIIESVFGYDYDADDRTIDAHIKLLRKKLGKYKDSIKTIRKVGYKFAYEEE